MTKTILRTAALMLGAAVLLIQSAAFAQERIRFDIPAQSLATALRLFQAQSGAAVLYSPELVANKQAAAVSGELTAIEAVRQLLRGTGLEAEADEGGRLTIRTTKQEAVDQQLPEVEVSAAFTANPLLLSEPFAGGQVARGGQLGILGNRDLMDTPFNQSNYTAELMQNQGARFVADALENDPTARTVGAPSSGADWFSIRGFDVGNQDIRFNGMNGIAPSFFNSLMAESFERIEVIKGPNALLNGMAQGGSVGGAINVVPKRAGNAPLTQFTADYISESQIGGHLDVGRRFGQDKEFGIRVNAVYRDGDTPIDRQSRESQLLAFGLDYQAASVRLSADLGYQEQDLKGVRGIGWTGIDPAVTAVPKAPDNRTNYFDPTEFSNPTVYYGMLQGEFDLSERWTAFASAGGSEREHLANGSFRLITNNQGDLAAGEFWNFSTAMKVVQQAGEAGVRGRLETGPLKHLLVFAYSAFGNERFDTPGAPVGIPFPASNIYNPVFGSPQDVSTLQGLDQVVKSGETNFASTTIADTVSFHDELVQVTLGARQQEIDTASFDAVTGAITRSYEDQTISPMAGIVVRPRKDIAVYGNYIEGLQQGPTAPPGTANAGEVFAPTVTKQYEAGVKLDTGRLGAALALYQIAQPSGLRDPVTTIFAVDGEQRNRGIDFNLFGEVTRGVRVLGGAAYIDAVLTKTEGGVNEGNTAPGVPEWRFVLGGEWDTPFAQHLTLTGRVVHTGSTYANSENTLTVPAWTRLDLGARYKLRKNVTIRANLYNVLDENYWESSTNFVLQNEPRTFSLSTTFDF